MASFLIRDVGIFDGENKIEKGAVLVEDGKITQFSRSEISFSGTTISKPGHTLLPGLIDCHVHADSANPTALPQSLRFGVTTVCDMHNEFHNVEILLKQIREEGDCADLKYSSFSATVDMGWPMAVVLAHSQSPTIMEELALWPKLKGPEDAKGYLQDRQKEGVNYIKLMHESGSPMGQQFNMPSIELQKALVEEAHNAGFIAVAHALALKDTIEILNAGVDGMTHTFLDGPSNQDLIDAYKLNGAHCNPTLAAIGSLTTQGRKVQEKFAHDPRVRDHLSENAKQRMCACMAFAQDTAGADMEHAFESVRQLKAAGIDIVVGSDAAGPAVGTGFGVTMHQELYLLVKECDFTPAEALRAATFLNAKRFGFHDRGQIKEGLRADLLLVEGDPTIDIEETLNIRGVWTEGKLCKAFEGL